jgi:hypothetical protein
MGIYLNPDNVNFKATLTRPIYVDKTGMISVINQFMATDNKYVCVSRPRRFGKTITTNMLAAYYSKGCDSKDLFAPYKIASAPDFESNLNKFNVIQIDMNSEYQNIADKDNLLKKLTGLIRNELKEVFTSVVFEESDTLGECIQKIYTATKETFVIFMDEYDVLVREKVSDKLFSEYLGFLNGLFKSNTLRPAISFAYLTGILPVVRDRIQSKLNNFDELTILDAHELAEFVGFTSDEDQELCKRYNVDYEECKRWYDGYNQHGFEIYNPESVVMCMRSKTFSDYWSRTSTYAAIEERIRMNFDGTKEDVIKMLAGESIDVNVTRFMNTMDSFSSKSDVFTYLIHIGYLAYNATEGTCKIPNKEIRQQWYNAIEANSDYAVTNAIIQQSKALLAETLNGNESAVAKALDVSHIHVTSNRSYNNEDALQSAIYLAFIYALNKYTVIKELTSGKGFADVVFIPFVQNLPAMIIELKRNACADSAINQIKDKRYFDSLSHYSGDLLFVGINYDEDSKNHECKIERFVKGLNNLQ